MTIKIIQDKMAGKVEQVGRPATYLYECDEVFYKFVDFNNEEEFFEKYKNITEGLENSYIIGIPNEYWEDKKIEPDKFLSVYYNKNCLILQNVTVYIMQGGQTVDKIFC